MEKANKIPISIAEILLDLTSPLTVDELGIKESLGLFFGIPETPLATVKLRWEESMSAPEPEGKLIYDPGYIWKMYRDEKYYFAAFNYGKIGRSNEAKCLLRANPAWNDLVIYEQRAGSMWQSILSIGAGDLILRTALVFIGGLVFHASGLIDNGKGIVFIGHSGAGKSTQVDIWREEPGVIIVNHDRMAVRANNSISICYGTPWGGTADVALNLSAPLSALIILEQAANNYIEEVTPMAAASVLSACAFMPYWDAPLMVRALENLNTVLDNVPVYRLYCRPEKGVIPVVRSILC